MTREGREPGPSGGLCGEPGCFRPSLKDSHAGSGGRVPFSRVTVAVSILVYTWLSGEANSPLPQSCYLSPTVKSFTVGRHGRPPSEIPVAAAPMHRDCPPVQMSAFELSIQYSHCLRSVRKRLPSPAHSPNTLQQMLLWGYCNIIINLTLIWLILPFALLYGTQGPVCKQKELLSSS